MSKEKRRVPKLRFPGFTEDWEQRKLSDILKVNSGKDYKHLEQGDIPVYGTGGYMLSVNESLSNIDAIGIGRKGTIDKPQYLKAPFWTVDTLFYLTALDKHSILFLYYLMQLMPWKKFDESTGVPSLSKTTIDNINGYVPSNPKEEELISTLFNQLDKSITLHQRKLNNLKLKKKALLQKLFPKNGKRYPELRFPGFTDAWEQRKLGDVADVRDGTHDSPKFYNDGFPLVTSKNLKDGSIDFSDCSFISKQDFDEINKRSKVDSGDILFGMIGTIGNPAIVEHTGFAIKNVALIKEGIIVNNRFIYHLLSSKVFDNYIARENAGGTQKFIALNQIRNFIFLAPTLEEQNKIIELLDYISQTITLHQRKLDHLQLQKKALLQQMFV